MLNFRKISKKNICLIGLMGSGKTIIGKDLSKILKINFFDTDNEIEKKVGKKINLIFLENGEDYFRKIEEDICLDILKNKNCIISLGGGSILNQRIRTMISKYSFSIYLKVDINNLIKRLKYSNKRPLLIGKNKKKILEEIYEKRKQFYNNADLVIENNLDKYDLIERIKKNIV